jgi:hypothetical protein
MEWFNGRWTQAGWIEGENLDAVISLGVRFNLKGSPLGKRSVLYDDTASGPATTAQGQYGDVWKTFPSGSQWDYQGGPITGDNAGGGYSGGRDSLALTASGPIKNANVVRGAATLTLNPPDATYVVMTHATPHASPFTSAYYLYGMGSIGGTGTFLWLKKSHTLKVSISIADNAATDRIAPDLIAPGKGTGTIRLDLDLTGKF